MANADGVPLLFTARTRRENKCGPSRTESLAANGVTFAVGVRLLSISVLVLAPLFKNIGSIHALE